LKNFETLLQRQTTLGKLFERIIEAYSSQEELEVLNKFREKRGDLAVAEKPFMNALEVVKSNIKWVNVNLKNVGEWLANYVEKLKLL
jgi:hypothetical protein